MPTPELRQIVLRGARTHNLQNVDLDLTVGQLIVLTGLSGSGKSSLAFDTLHAESRRRYLTTISPRLRQLLDRHARPLLDRLEGLPPTIAVGQYRPLANDRASVASLCEVLDLVRVLYARAGVLHCPKCQIAVTTSEPVAAIERLLAQSPGGKVLVLAPLVREHKGSLADVFARVTREGLLRARVDGRMVEVASVTTESTTTPAGGSSVEAVVDRLVLKDSVVERMRESLEVALQLGQGVALLSVEVDDTWRDVLVSPGLTCAACGTAYLPLAAANFSRRSVAGQCPECEGLGIRPSAEEPVSSGNQMTPAAPSTLCSTCAGTGWGPIARSTVFQGRTLPQLLSLSPSAAATVLEASLLDSSLAAARDEARPAIERLVPQCRGRLAQLVRLGLDYLSLDRSAETLSAGEVRRCQLAASLASELRDVCYILDEPSAGLHAIDADKLWERLHELRSAGNTVIVVEHELGLVRRADDVVDLGPGAGRAGGHIVARGRAADLMAQAASPTGAALRSPVVLPTQTRAARGQLLATGARLRNLRQVTVEIPRGQLVAVTGVSGSGKTTLVLDTLVPALRSALVQRAAPSPEQLALLQLDGLDGWEGLSDVRAVDQRSLGRSRRSKVATVTGLWDEVRRLYAKTREARLLGLRPSAFSWLHPEGRCPECRGRGTISAGGLLDDISAVRCPACHGRRFHPRTLGVVFQRHSVADLLDLTIEAAAELFRNLSRLHAPLRLLTDVGLGYLTLGQSTLELSGGESTRLKLATELMQRSWQGEVLYVLDEPCAGLHVQDIRTLHAALSRLVDEGHTVIVVEHRLPLIAACDWMIELGPGAGPEGGHIIAAGVPLELARTGQTPTSAALQRELRS